MTIYTRIVLDLNGNVLESDSFEYQGPLALCDRAMQQQAAQAGKQATQTAGQYGATAGQVGGFLMPQLEKFATAPPGYSPMDEANMQTQALLSGASDSGAARQEATLRGARTGNLASVPGQNAAITEAAARGTGGMLQNILAKNAELKAQQQRQAQQELGGLYGTAERGQIGAESLVPEDVKAGVEAGKSGWLQNMINVMKVVNSLGGTLFHSAGNSGGSAGGSQGASGN